MLQRKHHSLVTEAVMGFALLRATVDAKEDAVRLARIVVKVNVGAIVQALVHLIVRPNAVAVVPEVALVNVQVLVEQVANHFVRETVVVLATQTVCYNAVTVVCPHARENANIIVEVIAAATALVLVAVVADLGVHTLVLEVQCWLVTDKA